MIYNGKYYPQGTPVVSTASRGFRYGDGCFETMKVVNGQIAMRDLHFGRLVSSMETLGFDISGFHQEEIDEQVRTLCKKNNLSSLARIRLTIFRKEGAWGVTENETPDYAIDTFSLDVDCNYLNPHGLETDVYRDARKNGDHYSHIKSNNFLAYVLAHNWARQHELDDAILLNSFDRVVEASAANLFIVKEGVIKTPVLTEGCVAGAMRKYIINSCRKEGIPVEEKQLSLEELHSASEVFLTNAIRGIRWVASVGETSFDMQLAKHLHKKMIQPLWA